MNEDDRIRLVAMLEAADWEDLVPRLLAVTNYYLSTRHATLPGHRKPHDIVTEAVNDVVSGTHEPSILRTLYHILSARIAYLVYRDSK